MGRNSAGRQNRLSRKGLNETSVVRAFSLVRSELEVLQKFRRMGPAHQPDLNRCHAPGNEWSGSPWRGFGVRRITSPGARKRISSTDLQHKAKSAWIDG